jgi:flagellin-like protein
MNKTIKKIKAVSPIVATIILIIITIIAGIVIYFYVSGYLAGGATNVSLKISGGAVAPGAGTKVFVTLTIKNDGTVPIRLTFLKVINPAVGSDASVQTIVGLVNLSAVFSGTTPPMHALIAGGTQILAAGQSITVQYKYEMDKPAAGFNTVISVEGENTVTGQTVGFLVNIAITPA